MPAVAKKTVHSPDVDLSKMKRGRSPFADKRVQLSLADLREFAGAKTQVEVSRASGIPQGEISKIENREDLDVIALATLRRYVEALGGELEVAAVLGGRRVVIKRGA
jgi:nucleotide-binding universal stress UspA family protein